jgi:hypothetical protein
VCSISNKVKDKWNGLLTIEFQEHGEKGDISLKKGRKVTRTKDAKKSVSFSSLCSVTYFGSSQMKHNQTYSSRLIYLPFLYLPFLHLQSRKKNYDKEKTLKTVIISVFICFILHMVHSSGSHSKKSEQKWKGRKGSFLVFLQYIHESPF